MQFMIGKENVSQVTRHAPFLASDVGFKKQWGEQQGIQPFQDQVLSFHALEYATESEDRWMRLLRPPLHRTSDGQMERREWGLRKVPR